MTVAMNGDTSNRNIIDSSKKSRCRGKQKKNKKASKANVVEADVSVGSDSNAIVTEYVPEKAEFEYGFNDEFSKIFDKFFNSREPLSSEKKDKVKKKVNSDSDEEQEQEKDTYTNKKNKRQRRMKISELKKLSTRPNVVEVWDVTSADPELLVFLKSYHQDIGLTRGNIWKGRLVTRSSHSVFLISLLQPEAMDNVLPVKYEEAREEERQCNKQENFSDIVADYNNSRKRKRQEHDQEGKKKKKDFKF